VHKGSTQTNKKIKVRVQSKGAKKPNGALVWRTGLSDVPRDSVRCTRTVQLRTLHLRGSLAALRYNSPDCPVHQRSNDYQRNGRLQRTPANATVRGQCAQKSEQPPEAHWTVNNTCPVRHRTVRCTSGATTTSATVDCNGHLQTLQCADSVRRSQSSRQRRTGQ
jgi:hypothetical protein